MANKSPAPKPSARKKTATSKKPAKAASLQDELKRLEARLKRANTTTQKSVTALETIVQTLDARVTSNKTTGKAQLTRQVNALRKRLEAQITDVRTTIRADLKNALSQGGLVALEPALARASATSRALRERST